MSFRFNNFSYSKLEELFKTKGNHFIFMEVICLEEEAFYNLIEKVVDRLKEKSPAVYDRWLNEEQVKRLLNIN